MSNQEGVHTSVRAVTGTSYDYLSDWHALFDANSVASGPWNERMLRFLNTNLGTSYTALNDAMNAFAIAQGFPGGWNDMNSFTLSAAAAMLAAETQGLAIDFTDDAFLGRDLFYGSAEIKDTTTPANNYSAAPTRTASSLLTYTSPSVKMVMGPSGTLRYQAHNLYLNSASPANQSVTVVSGATYSVIITGSVSTTLSGAATGTITSGTTSFTAATGTLTFGSTSGSGTVQVTRTPADLTYLATTDSARYALPLEWSSAGVLQGMRVEETRTNLALYSSDLTNAAWTKTNMTTAKTATGPDGVSNSATTCTATAGNATALQAITSGSAARISNMYIKRRTGSGTINITSDNGTTWTAVTVTSDWTRVESTVQTLTNPTVGIRIVTSGDAVDVALFGHEVGSFSTSPIESFASTVTRAADNISLATSAFPAVANPGTIFVEYKLNALKTTAAQRLVTIDAGSSANMVYLIGNNTAGSVDAVIATASVGQGFNNSAVSSTNNMKQAFAYATNDSAHVINGGSPITDATVSTAASYTTLRTGSDTFGAAQTDGYLKKIMILPRRMTNTELQTLTG